MKQSGPRSASTYRKTTSVRTATTPVTTRYRYVDASGKTVVTVVRMDFSDGTKKIHREPKGVKAPPGGWPLFNLQGLAKRPHAPVLVVEGELTAGCAADLFPEYVAVTALGGTSGKGASGNDWTSLRDRDVTVWPDNDKPGIDHAGHVAALCQQAGAATVRRVDVANIPNLPTGWDVADAPLDGFDVQKALAEANGSPLPLALQWPRSLDLVELAARDPKPPQFIVENWLPAGYATMLAGHGGAGKSTIALTLAVCIAAGLPFCELPTKQCRVMYLSCEDAEDLLHWRLRRICDHLGVDLAALHDELTVYPMVRSDPVLWAPDGETVRLDVLKREMTAHQAKVLFLDGTADVFSGNENARAEVKRFINSLLPLTPDDGAVMLIAHVDKQSARTPGGTEGYSGSTAWHNAVRARWYLYPEKRARNEEDAEHIGDLVLELQKLNLGRSDQKMRFRWDTGTHLFLGQCITPRTKLDHRKRDEREQTQILEALKEARDHDYVPAATTGSRTAYHVLSVQPSFPDSLCSGKTERRRFWHHVETLCGMRKIRHRRIRRPNRHGVDTLEPASQQ